MENSQNDKQFKIDVWDTIRDWIAHYGKMYYHVLCF